MINIVRGVTIFFCILIGAALLNGAGVGFDRWYAAPKNLSQALVTILTLVGLVKIAMSVINFFFVSRSR